MSPSAVVSTPSDTEILITRSFDAPKQLVWRAFTEPDLVSKWWPGQRGQMQSCEIDFRAGGAWRYVMISSDGFEVGFHGEYQEIVEHERIVHTEVYEGAPGPGILVVNTFDESDGRTTVRMLSQTGSQEVRDIILGSGMEGGVQEGMDIIDTLLAELTAGDRASGVS